MKQATTVVPFRDLEEGVLREIGDAFLCGDERGEYLASLGLVRLQDAPKEKPKKKTTKKK